MMTVLQEKGINVPFPVPNLEGQDMSYEKIYAVEKNNWEDNNGLYITAKMNCLLLIIMPIIKK